MCLLEAEVKSVKRLSYAVVQFFRGTRHVPGIQLSHWNTRKWRAHERWARRFPLTTSVMRAVLLDVARHVGHNGVNDE